MKQCFKCGSEQPLSEFYRHRMMADGHLGKCKTCTKSDVAEHRRRNIKAVRAYDRSRAALPHRAELRRKVGWMDREKNPLRNRVRLRARRAFPVPPDFCEHCGGKSSRIERHHLDYSQPLLIEWLCKPCHSIADAKRRQKEQAA